VPGPETVQTWQVLAHDDPLLTDGINALQRAFGTDQLVGGPYVSLDIPSLLRAAMSPEIDAEFVEGADALHRFFGARLDTRTALARPVDVATLARFRASGVDRVIVEGSALVPSRSRSTLAQPFALSSASAGTPGETVNAVASDSDLTRLLEGTEPAPIRTARLFAGLSLVAFEQPKEVRAVALVNAGDFDPPVALLDGVLAGLRGNPLLHALTVDQVFDQVPAETNSDGSAAVHTLAAYEPPVPPVSLDQFNARLGRLNALRALAPTAAVLPSAQRALLSSLSSAWYSADQSAKARAELSSVDTAVDSFLAQIHAPNRSTITLTSRSGDIPLTFRNDTGAPVNVLVQLESPKLSFPDGAQRVVTLPPQSTTVRFAVEARTSGSFPVRLTLLSADGALTIAQAGVRINANAVSAVSLVLIISAVLFLALWWIVHIRRERQRKLVGVESE
jgi:hypothetical protein